MPSFSFWIMGVKSRNAYFKRMNEKEKLQAHVTGYKVQSITDQVPMEFKPLKVAVIIPDRGDRPDFMEHCEWMILNQINCGHLEYFFVNYPARSDKCDITERYRTAYHSFDGAGLDCILFMENDDWYSPFYIHNLVKAWIENGKPDLFGIGYTYYYHIGINKYIKFDHPRRASMMNTLIKPDLKFEWCADDYPYTDAWLWNKIKNRKTWLPEAPISIGIKHGIGKSGGEYHRTKLERYNNDDSDLSFLSSIVDQKSLEFYKEMNEKAFKR